MSVFRRNTADEQPRALRGPSIEITAGELHEALCFVSVFAEHSPSAKDEALQGCVLTVTDDVVTLAATDGQVLGAAIALDFDAVTGDGEYLLDWKDMGRLRNLTRSALAHRDQLVSLRPSGRKLVFETEGGRLRHECQPVTNLTFPRWRNLLDPVLDRAARADVTTGVHAFDPALVNRAVSALRAAAPELPMSLHHVGDRLLLLADDGRYAAVVLGVALADTQVRAARQHLDLIPSDDVADIA